MLPAREPTPELRRDCSADVAIIGAGFTGIAAARRWHELAPGDDILLMDASTVGEGNAGRNSGFMLEVQLAEDARSDQVERMRACNELLAHTVRSLVNDLATAGAGDAMRHTGTYRAVASAAGERALANYEAFLNAAGMPFEQLSRADLQERLGTAFYAQGLYSPHCYLAQPAAVIRALASLLPAAVRLHENTAVLSIHKRGDAWRLQTPHASIDARRVLLANNAFAAGLSGDSSRLAAIYTYAGLTAPLDEAQLQALGSEDNWGLLPTHPMGSTLRRTADGRLLLRSLHSHKRELQELTVQRLLLDRLRRRYPQLQLNEFEQLWGGAVGYTRSGGLLWGQLRPGLFAACGCNGGGTVKGTLFGSLMADLALGFDVPDVAALFGRASWMPPEPLRSLGYRVIAGWQAWRGRGEI